jgi:hypothetical protein
MEGADGLVVPTRLLKLDILAHDVHYVQPLLHLIDDAHNITNRTNEQA